MCGRYTYTQPDLYHYEQVLETGFPLSLEPRYNIAPSQQAAVIHAAEQGYVAALMRWGLVPRWSKEPATKYSTINAKVETVASKPAYRDAFRHRRCLVPADGYYEWQQSDGSKQPYYLHMGGKPFAFAGLWEHWAGEGADPFDSYTIITGPATRTTHDIHPRMPIILPEPLWKSWLDAATSPLKLSDILTGAVEGLRYHPISTRVNNPRNEGAELVNPVKT